MTRPKVLHYKDGQYLPVTETWIYTQIRHLKKFEPIVYCRESANLDIYPAAQVRSKHFKEQNSDLMTLISKSFNAFLCFYPQDLLFIAQDKPQLIHAHYGPAGYNLLGLKKMTRLPLVTTFYGFDVIMLPTQQPKWKAKYQKLFREGDLFLVEGSHMKACLVKMGCPEHKVVVNQLGIDLDKIRFESRRPAADGAVRFLAAGGFREKKGLPDAVAAFGELVKRYPERQLTLTIIGDSSGSSRENAEKKRILDTIERYGLAPRVKLLGFKPHSFFIEQLYQHDIFISPSVHAADGDTEGGAPVSIIEASASGMPVVSTTHCDIPEVVLDGHSGSLAAEHDIPALSAHMENLVLHPELWPEMGRQGRSHIEKNYDARKQGVRLEALYEELTGVLA